MRSVNAQAQATPRAARDSTRSKVKSRTPSARGGRRASPDGYGEGLRARLGWFGSAVGVDPDPEMVEVARANGAGNARVRFLRASAENLEPLGAAAFDVVLTRHAPVYLPELDRVTRAGGVFICQGVGSRNMANIRHAFNTGSEVLYERAHRALLRDLVDVRHGLDAETRDHQRFQSVLDQEGAQAFVHRVVVGRGHGDALRADGLESIDDAIAHGRGAEA